MTRHSLAVAVAVALALPALDVAQSETRALGAHEHGTGSLAIAIEGRAVAIELEAPGADIVGFEHAAESDADRAAIAAATARLEDPLALFVMPAAAGCTLVSATVALHAGGEDEGQAHGGAHAGKHDHAGEDGHSEFHAEYRIDCADPSQLTRIEMRYFEAFPNAEELDVQMVTEKGATAVEVDRASPVLDLAGLI